MLGFLPISVTCHVRDRAAANVDPSFCTPNNQKTIDIFRGFKKVVNTAAQTMAVPHAIDASNPNLDEDMFRLMIFVAQTFDTYMTEKGRAADVPPLMRMLARAKAGQSPDEFRILADNIEPLMLQFQTIAQGEYGKRVVMTPTVPKPPELPPGGLVLIAGAALLGAAVIYVLTPTATKGAL